MVKVAIYARVSTAGQSAEMQLRELREYCIRRSAMKGRPQEWIDVTSRLPCDPPALRSMDEGTQEFIDVEVGSSDRAALNEMLALIRQRKIGVVIVWRLDRLARSLKQLISLLEEFRALGIEFVSLHEQIDTSTPAGRLQFSILGAFAEFERGIIQERVRSGLMAAKSKGKTLGRPKRVFDRELVATLRRQGRSWHQIEAQTGIPIPTLVRTLKAIPKTPLLNIGTGS